jgi:hypothetical protein
MNNLKRDSSDMAPECPSAGPANSRDDALERQLAKQHGALLGPVLAEAAKKLRAEAIAKLREQNARLTAAKEALQAATVEGEKRAAAAYVDMERARVAWQKASELYERERIAAQSACVPLQNQVYEIVREINEVDLACGGKVKQWDSGDHVTAPRAMPVPDA